MSLPTFLEEIVAAVINAFPAVVGGNEAGEGAEAGSEEDGEFDHFDSGNAFGLIGKNGFCLNTRCLQ